MEQNDIDDRRFRARIAVQRHRQHYAQLRKAHVDLTEENRRLKNEIAYLTHVLKQVKDMLLEVVRT